MDLFVLKKIKEGDIKAFESIFRLYYTPLCLYADQYNRESRKLRRRSFRTCFMYSGKKENLFQSYVPSRTTFMELPGTGPYNIWSIGKYDTDTGIRF